ncbi:MAG: DUF4339 domain-containing protein [Pirellulales bacterium]
MGIRFQCHHCSHPLHVKDYQAGKKGRCPECKGQFRIPMSDAEFSLDPAAVPAGVSDASTASAISSVGNDTTQSRIQTSRTSAPATSQPVPKVVSDQPPLNFDLQNYDAVESVSVGPGAQANEVAQATQVSEVFDLNLTQPSVLAEAPNATWYVRPAQGGQYGPAPSGVFWQWLLEGRIDVDALVWRDDWAEWQPASNVFADYFARLQSAATVFEPPSNDQFYSQPGPTVYGVAPNPFPAQPGVVYVPTVAVQQLPSSVPATTATAGTIAPAAAKRQMQNRSRRTKYMIAIAVLTVLMISLAVGLAIVLYRQKLTS